MRNYFVSYIFGYKEFGEWYKDNYGNNIISYPFKVCTEEHIAELEKILKKRIGEHCHASSIYVVILYFKEVYDE